MDYAIAQYQQNYCGEILRIWNENLKYDLINKERFMDRIILDENFSAKYFLVALDDGKVVGFAYGVKRQIPYLERGLEEERAWINIIAVEKTYQRNKVGTLLLQELEGRFREAGVKEITLCAYSPNYFTPGIDVRYGAALPFFEQANYISSSQAVSMKRELWDYYMTEETKEKIANLSKEGVIIKPYEEAYTIQLMEFASREFGAGWKRNVMMAMQQQIAEKTIFLAVDGGDEIIGFVMRKIDGNDARFGPIGVNKNIRSKGLGSLLLQTMMNDMREREVYEMYFLWTGGAAQKFYQRHGFEVYREYKLYKKVI